MGPHGLCVGATGSGRSEFLRTLTLGLMATHAPDSLNLVLVDFKGGATFAGFERSRHVAALITNLSTEAHLVARMKDALAGELNRRQEVLRESGRFASVADYERARESGAPLAPLPALVVIVDEFSELLSQHPDFAEMFVAIGRLGRSLRIHLLLATQRLDEGRLRGLESHLSYRICLKTFSPNESRAVIGTPDAFHLPSTPGAAFLRVGSEEPVRFQIGVRVRPVSTAAEGQRASRRGVRAEVHSVVDRRFACRQRCNAPCRRARARRPHGHGCGARPRRRPGIGGAPAVAASAVEIAGTRFSATRRSSAGSTRSANRPDRQAVRTATRNATGRAGGFGRPCRRDRCTPVREVDRCAHVGNGTRRHAFGGRSPVLLHRFRGRTACCRWHRCHTWAPSPGGATGIWYGVPLPRSPPSFIHAKPDSVG